MFSSPQRETLYILAVTTPFSYRDKKFKMWEIHPTSGTIKLKENN